MGRLDNTGYYRTRFWERIARGKARFASLSTEPDPDLTNDSDIAVELAVAAAEDDEQDRATEDLILSLSPNTVTSDKAMDDILTFRATEGRFMADAARGELTILGATGTQIPIWTQIPGPNGLTYLILQTVIIGQTGRISAPAQCKVKGPQGNSRPDQFDYALDEITVSNPSDRRTLHIGAEGSAVWYSCTWNTTAAYMTLATTNIAYPLNVDSATITIRNPGAAARWIRLELRAVNHETGVPLGSSGTMEVYLEADETQVLPFAGLGWNLTSATGVRLYPVNVSLDRAPVEVKLVNTGAGWNEVGGAVADRALQVDLVSVVDGQFRGGQNAESIWECRARYGRSLDRGGSWRPTALESHLRRIPGLDDVKIDWNPTQNDQTELSGLPPKSFRVTVLNGDRARVGRAIAYEMSGCGDPVGEHIVLVPDETDPSVVYETRHDRAALLYAEFEIGLTLKPEFPAGGRTKIIDQIIRYVGGYDSTGVKRGGMQIGEALSFSRLGYAIHLTPGVVNATIKVRFAGSLTWYTEGDLPDGTLEVPRLKKLWTTVDHVTWTGA